VIVASLPRESGQSLLSTDDSSQPKNSPKPSPRASPNPKKGSQPSKLVDLGAASSYGSQKQQQSSSGGGGDIWGDMSSAQPAGNTGDLGKNDIDGYRDVVHE